MDLMTCPSIIIPGSKGEYTESVRGMNFSFLILLSKSLKPRDMHFEGFAFIVSVHFNQVLVRLTAICMSAALRVINVKSSA